MQVQVQAPIVKKGTIHVNLKVPAVDLDALPLKEFEKDGHPMTYAEEEHGKDDEATSTTKTDLIEGGKITGHFIADDMVIAPHQKAAYEEHGLDAFVQARSKAWAGQNLWTNGHVPYKFHSSFGFQKEAKIAMEGMMAGPPPPN